MTVCAVPAHPPSMPRGCLWHTLPAARCCDEKPRPWHRTLANDLQKPEHRSCLGLFHAPPPCDRQVSTRQPGRWSLYQLTGLITRTRQSRQSPRQTAAHTLGPRFQTEQGPPKGRPLAKIRHEVVKREGRPDTRFAVSSSTDRLLGRS